MRRRARAAVAGLVVGVFFVPYEWLNPRTGMVAGSGAMTVGAGNVSFRPPFTGDAVLFLSR